MNTRALVLAALAKVGALVGDGPHGGILVGFHQRNSLLFVAEPGQSLTEEQRDFFDSWPGQVSVVHSAAEALQEIGAATPDTVKKRKDFRNIRQWIKKDRR